jgi:REP element-mobilizing transposase RayT
MARGIEGREIFKDDEDRKSFLDRFAIILEETQTQCYAWALIPNHFHLLLRTGSTPISTVMRRLMTGYAVTFNRRHKRIGHLFQNRYKSIVCEEDAYLLELIRYIHLNPLRAGLADDLKELDKYPWSGHSYILGHHKNPLILNSLDKNLRRRRIYPPLEDCVSHFHPGSDEGQKNHPDPVNPVQEKKSLAEKTLEDVLLHFGDTIKVARRRYRHFVKQGVSQGTRPELQGGGLVRSAGGEKAGLLGRRKGERERGDERILGSGDFVTTVLRNSREPEPRRLKRVPLEVLSQKVASHFNIKEEDLRSPVKKKAVSEAKAAFSCLAIKKMGYSGREVGRFLNMRSYSAIRRSEEGEKILDKREFLWDLVQE